MIFLQKLDVWQEDIIKKILISNIIKNLKILILVERVVSIVRKTSNLYACQYFQILSKIILLYSF